MHIPKHYIDNRLITERSHPLDSGLKIYNYTPKVQFNKLWDGVTRKARGLIIKNDRIIAEPFHKFFNINETPETEIANLPNETPEITEKIDGALGILYPAPDNKLAISTRGSFESKEALWGTEYFRKTYKLPLDITEKYTVMFEIVSPVGKHVLKYPYDLYIIGVRDMQTKKLLAYSEVIYFAKQNKLKILPNFQIHTPLHLLPLDAEDIEGWVAMYPKAQLLIKIKTEKYREIHRYISSITYNNILELLEEGQYDDVISKVPPEIRPEADKIKNELLDRYNKIEEEIYRLYSKIPDGTQKEKAIWINRNVPVEYKGLVFCLLNKKEYNIWKLIKKERRK